MTAQDVGIGLGLTVSTLMGVLNGIRLKRVRGTVGEHVNGTPVKLEKLRLELLEICDALLIPKLPDNEAWRIRKIQSARERISQLPLLTAAQYRAAEENEE